MAAGIPPVQSENTKKVILGILVVMLVLLAGWRIYGGTRANEESARQVEQSVSQAGGPTGLPGVFMKMNNPSQKSSSAPSQSQTSGQ